MFFKDRYWVGPVLFSLFCNDLPEICDDEDGDLYMYADDTTIYVTGSDPDLVISALNKVLEKFMLLGGDRFVRALHGIKLGNFYIKRVSSSRCLDLEIDHRLKWNIHVTELFKLSFSQKLNLLKSLYFLPTNERLQFYSKVILPSITYGLLIW